MKIFLIFLIPLCLISFVSFAVETDKLKNTILLANNTPLDSDEGLSTPIIYYNYNSEPESDRPFFEFKLQTSTIRGDVKETTGTAWNYSYGVIAELISEANGMDIYANGERKKEITFDGDSLGAYFSIGYEITRDWNLNWQLLIKQAWFYESEYTGENYKLPSDFQTRLNSLNLTVENVFNAENSKFEVTLESGSREYWEDWQLATDFESTDSYYKEKIDFVFHHDWNQVGKSELKLSLAGGQHLDFFSGYKLGGLPGEYSVSGFFRNEFRAKEIIISNLSHVFDFNKHKKLLLFYDYAFYKRLPVSYLLNAPDSDSIQGVAVGFYFGIESLDGLPIIVRLGQGIDAPDQNTRREFMIAVAAKF